MYITNNPEIDLLAQECGVNRIFVDMEYLGKEVRQSGMDTVKLHHTIKDIQTLRPILTTADLLVRVNPIHDEIGQVESSKVEIDNAINAGADILMLPMVKTKQEAEKFVEFVGTALMGKVEVIVPTIIFLRVSTVLFLSSIMCAL